MRMPVSTIVSIPALSVSVFGAGMFLVSYGWFNVPFRYAMGWFGVGMLVGLLISLVIWTPMLFRDERKQSSVVYSNETAPVPEPVRYMEAEYTGGGMQGQFYDLPVDLLHLQAFAEHVLNGGNTTHAAIVSSGLMSRDKWEALRTLLVQKEWMRQEGREYVMTGKGIYQCERTQYLLPTKVRGTRNYRS